MRKFLLGVTAFTLILTSCQKSEVTDSVGNEENKLKFGAYQGKATKGSELTNALLNTKDVNFPLYAYKGESGKEKSLYFNEILTYSGTEWKTRIPRFLAGDAPLHFFAYYATGTTAGVVPGVTPITPPATLADGSYPALDYDVPTTQATQVDLVAATVEYNTSNTVKIPFKHILSQINFGVKGYYGAKITISNVKVMQVNSVGTFSFDPALWGWTSITALTNYTYTFPTFTTPGGEDNAGVWEDPNGESGIRYIFGDGGNWGPGKDASVWYVTADNTATQGSIITDQTTKLSNSLILMPQQLKVGVDTGNEAYVTFDYVIQDAEDAYIVGPTVAKGKFDLNIAKSTVVPPSNPKYGSEWESNLRYLYIIDFTGYLDGLKLTFDVDVESQPWENYDKPGDGIVLLSSLNGKIFEKIKLLANNGIHPIEEGHLFSDITWDWSSFNMDKTFTTGNTFTVTFKDVRFNNNKITIKPPFGFVVGDGTLTAQSTIDVTSTGTTLTFTPNGKAYYGSLNDLNTAIATNGNYDFNVSSSIKLSQVVTTGITTVGNKVVLNFVSPYSGPASGWAMSADRKTATYTVPTPAP